MKSKTVVGSLLPSSMVKPFRLPDPPVPGSGAFGRLIEGLTGAPVRAGNRVQVLRNGCQTFPAMLEPIAAATDTIDFSCYIYWPGSARHDPRQVDRLERAGATVGFFRTPHC